MAFKKAIGFLISAALSISCFPMTVHAATGGSTETGTEATASPDSTPAASTAAESPDPTAAPAAETPSSSADPESATAAPSASPEASAAAEPSASPDAETAEFPGMPDNYELTADQQETKAMLSDPATNEAEAVTAAVSGTDYVPQQIVYLADTQDYAATVAAAYGAQLLSFDSGVAVAVLPEGVAVADAVKASADLNSSLPAVEPNYLIKLEEPVDVEGSDYDSLSALGLVDQIPAKSMWSEYCTGDAFLQITSPKYQYYLENADVYDAWGTTKGSSQVKVAVLDTGIAGSQEDLSGRVSKRDVVTFDGINTAHFTPGDHGTHVAGIIGAKNGNGLGGSGIAPEVTVGDFQCLSNQMVNTEATPFSAIMAEYNKAVDWDADIINMSLTGVGYYADEQTIINTAASKGVVTVAAAGNEGTNRESYPGGYKNVICVGALNRDNSKAMYSEYGSWVDISAPGTDIWSTAAGGTSSDTSTTYDYSKTSDYQLMSGTSMATPVVTGAIALYMSAAGDRSGDVNGDGVRDVKDVTLVEAVLKKTAQKTGLTGMGAGCVDAGAMVATVIAAPVINATVAGSSVTDFSKPIVVPASGTSQLVLSSPMATYYIAYTTDGTAPVIKDGKLVNGTTYTAPIDLTGFADGSYTVKAVAVNGDGLVSAVSSVKMTLQRTTTGSSNKITIGGPLYVGLGKSVQLTATLLDGSKTGVVWSVVSGDATISSTGLLKTGKNAAANSTIIVKATSKANAGYYNQYSVKVVSLITSVTLAASGGISNGSTITSSSPVTLNPTVLAGTTTLGSSGYTLTWTSSSPKIATVDSQGKVTPVGKGLVTITAKATDGSGKTGTFKLNVQIQATSLTISADTTKIARGKSVKLTADILPAIAANRNVTWTVDEAAKAQKVMVSAAGVLTVPAKSTVTSVTVTAVTKDGSSCRASKTFTVLSAAAAKVTMALASRDGSHGVYSKTNVLQSITLYTSNPAGNIYYSDDATNAVLASTTDSGVAVAYASSNPSVATVSGSTVTAVREGKTTVTATALDGSGKKASVTVNVIVPASGITVGTKSTISPHSGSTDNADGVLYVAAGKTAVMQARLGTLYGKPTVKNVAWSVDSTAAGMKVVITSAGVLQVPAALNTQLTASSKEITVTAATTDGTNKTCQYKVMLTGKTTKIGTFKPSERFYVYDTATGNPSPSNIYQQPFSYAVGQEEGYLFFYSDSPSAMFTFTGTTGKANSDSSGYDWMYDSNKVHKYVYVGGKFYKLYVTKINIDLPLKTDFDKVSSYQYNTGASIKVTAADGTGVSAAASIKIWY